MHACMYVLVTIECAVACKPRPWPVPQLCNARGDDNLPIVFEIGFGFASSPSASKSAMSMCVRV